MQWYNFKFYCKLIGIPISYKRETIVINYIVKHIIIFNNSKTGGEKWENYKKNIIKKF